MFAWVCTIAHGLLTMCMVVGVLFSKTTFSMMSVLATLLLLLCMIRYFDGCFLSAFEKSPSTHKPTLTEMGISFSLKDDAAISGKHFEEIVVANLLLIHLIGMFCRLILPLEMLF